MLSPLILALPLFYWAFNWAGTWYVSTHIDPDQRRTFLHLTNAMALAMVACLGWFPGLLLLYAADYKRERIAWLLIPAGLLLVPGIFLLHGFIYCYVNYR
jgi:hypothetical protein